MSVLLKITHEISVSENYRFYEISIKISVVVFSETPEAAHSCKAAVGQDTEGKALLSCTIVLSVGKTTFRKAHLTRGPADVLSRDALGSHTSAHAAGLKLDLAAQALSRAENS